MAVGRERGGDSASLTRRESQLGNTGAEAYDRPARVGRSVGERRSTFDRSSSHCQKLNERAQTVVFAESEFESAHVPSKLDVASSSLVSRSGNRSLNSSRTHRDSGRAPPGPAHDGTSKIAGPASVEFARHWSTARDSSGGTLCLPWSSTSTRPYSTSPLSIRSSNAISATPSSGASGSPSSSTAPWPSPRPTATRTSQPSPWRHCAHSASQRQVDLQEAGVQEIVAGMRRLPAHPEVPRALARLRDGGLRLAALTNSPLPMAEEQLVNAGVRDSLEAVVSCSEVRRLKPASEPYQMAAERLAIPIGEMVLVAAHGWDVAGAMATGSRAIFVARPGQRWRTM
jgi:HAD superfamily hydrolase (TIGR01493 family)